MIRTLGDAVEHLVQDSGELYAFDPKYSEELTDGERELFARLYKLSHNSIFSLGVTECLEKVAGNRQLVESDLWAIVHDGKFDGDNPFFTSTAIKYREGMTIDKIKKAWIEHPDNSDLAEDPDDHTVDLIVGAWIIDDRIKEIATFIGPIACIDGAVYAANTARKQVIHGCAIKHVGQEPQVVVY